MPCPRCGSKEIALNGKYKLQRFNKPIRRLRCKKCNKHFSFRSFRKRINIDVREKIIRLYKTKKGYVNKYDHIKKVTYSTREIAKMLNVSKTFVWEIVKNEKSD